MAHRRKIGRIDDDAALENAPRVIVEVPAHHLAEFFPLVERRVSGVRADDPFAVFLYERHEVLLLLLGPVAFAGDEQKDRVEVVQVFRVSRRQRDRLLGDPLRVGADERVVEPRLPAELIDDGERVTDGIVRVARVRVGRAPAAVFAGRLGRLRVAAR